MNDSLCAHCKHCDEVKYYGFFCDKTGYLENKDIEEGCDMFKNDCKTFNRRLNKKRKGENNVDF